MEGKNEESDSTNNVLARRVIHAQRDRLVNQLKQREQEILQLTATLCGKGPCRFFEHHTLKTHVIHGSFNLSFFIQFSDDKKCVFRIPLRPCLAYSAHEKLRSEVVTMQYLAELGTIPVPKVLAYRADDSPDPLSTFAILEFIHGRNLRPVDMIGMPDDHEKNILTSLANIFLHLRRQEFPSIGRLDGSASNPSVGQKIASVSMNSAQTEGGANSLVIRDSFHDEHGVLQSATSFTKMKLCISYDAFLKCPNAVASCGLETVRNYQLFIKHVQEWLDPERDKGPFVLTHGDFHLSNLVFDDECHIIGVLDWEWSGVVPVQYFTPPTWFVNGNNFPYLYGRKAWDYFLDLGMEPFLEIIKIREMEMFGNLVLHNEWSQSAKKAEPLVAVALENWTGVDWFVHSYLLDEKEPDEAEKAALVKESPWLGVLTRIKECDSKRYLQSIRALASKQDSTEEMDKEMDKAGSLPKAESNSDSDGLLRAANHDAGTLMEKIRTLMTTNLVGWSVAACVVTAAIWKVRHVCRP